MSPRRLIGTCEAERATSTPCGRTRNQLKLSFLSQVLSCSWPSFSTMGGVGVADDQDQDQDRGVAVLLNLGLIRNSVWCALQHLLSAARFFLWPFFFGFGYDILSIPFRLARNIRTSPFVCSCSSASCITARS
jgi:hypothetical protein